MPEVDTEQQLSLVLITLFKGVLYQDRNTANWQALLQIQDRVRDYVSLLGLELMLDEAEGYAYLRHRPVAADEPELPRLVPRRPLSYPRSLLVALLRKKLAEHDALGGETRLILSRDQIVEMLRLFLPESANEARLMDRINSDINKVIELGFLRRLRGQEHQYEVRRILKAFVDGQWLSEFDQRLSEYREQLAGDAET